MGDYWFTGDQHFHHDSIIDYMKRPWKTTHLMNTNLVSCWNEYVKPKDVVVCVGDFWFMNCKMDIVLEWAQANLNGTIIFLKGNHDRWYTRDKKYMYIKKISGVVLYCGHYPLASWPSGVNIHGHSHGNLEKIDNRFDVGVDTNPEYRPYHIDEIKQMINWDLISRFARESYDYVQ